MATRAAHKRLTREYQIIQKNPPPYIVAHPSESNILEWHYILTGPPQTPYEGGQFWASFPRTTPSPPRQSACWEVSTILIGLMSFMTSEEMTTGSVSGTDAERRLYAQRTRWWNSTGGGSTVKTIEGLSGKTNAAGHGNVKAGDGGAKFRAEWADIDEENWRYLKEKRIDPKTGIVVPDPAAASSAAGTAKSCAPGAEALRGLAGSGSGGLGGVVVEGGQQAREGVRGWLGRNRMMILVGVVLGYAVLARVMSDGGTGKRG